jgi:inward rectifier potassium channel
MASLKSLFSTKKHISVQTGTLEFVKLNAQQGELRDVYQWLVKLDWPSFFVIVGITYVGINSFFAGLYLAGGDCVDGMEKSSDAFFFSVETLATVGYGHMFPKTLYGHTVATIEIVTGMFGMALMTGLMFVRFSRPVARIAFSKVIVIHPFNGFPTLTYRVANLRHHPMAEANFRLLLIRQEPVLEGGRARRYIELNLQFHYMISFPAVLTIRHTIDESSPLYGCTPESLKEDDSLFVASVVCIDTALPASVNAQYQYVNHDVNFDYRFTNIFTEDKRHRIVIDYAKLDEIEPFPLAAAAVPVK